MESTFDKLNDDILEGMSVGKNNFIPIGLAKLGRYANLRKKILTLIFSNTGCGKSSFLDTIILNACNHHMKHPEEMRPDFQLFSFERNSSIRIAKWICFLIFVNEGIEIQLPKMLGWWEEKITPAEHALILKQKPYIDQILNDYITIHDGAKTPNEVYKIMKDHFEANGDYEEVLIKGHKQRIYIAKNDRIVVVPAFDHGNLTKTTKELPNKKQAIDKLVTYAQGFRDLEFAAPIWISQVNRAISAATRDKDREAELVLDDVKESGDIVDACDLAISLFDPLKHGQSSKTGYKPADFVDMTTGANYFRSAQILKSSYGMDSVRIPLAFNGFCGQFTELPKKTSLSESQYEQLVRSVLSKEYFLNT